MSNEHVHLEHLETDSAQKPAWFTALVAETATLDQTGVNAAVLSLRLAGGENVDRQATQVTNLLRRMVRSTDRIGQTSSTSFSLLLAPLRSIADTTAQVHVITNALRDANISASAGYAQRRPAESLLDTWARAEAQADRAAFRAVHAKGLSLAE